MFRVVTELEVKLGDMQIANDLECSHARKANSEMIHEMLFRFVLTQLTTAEPINTDTNGGRSVRIDPGVRIYQAGIAIKVSDVHDRLN